MRLLRAAFVTSLHTLISCLRVGGLTDLTAVANAKPTTSHSMRTLRNERLLGGISRKVRSNTLPSRE
jgi:hypothetical protein